MNPMPGIPQTGDPVIIYNLKLGTDKMVVEGKATLVECLDSKSNPPRWSVVFDDEPGKTYDRMIYTPTEEELQTALQNDETEEQQAARKELEEHHAVVWNTAQMRQLFEVISFCAPFVEVRRRHDGQRGLLEFQHAPRFYYSFTKL